MHFYCREYFSLHSFIYVSMNSWIILFNRLLILMYWSGFYSVGASSKWIVCLLTYFHYRLICLPFSGQPYLKTKYSSRYSSVLDRGKEYIYIYIHIYFYSLFLPTYLYVHTNGSDSYPVPQGSSSLSSLSFVSPFFNSDKTCIYYSQYDYLLN